MMRPAERLIPAAGASQSIALSLEQLYDQGMSQAAIEQDRDHVASLAADLHDAHARLVDFTPPRTTPLRR
jgi:Trk K+ transport system NAD-binding subunit